jgi:hypothetical protein
MSRHPYESLTDARFWSRAVTWPPPGRLDPVGRSFRIEPGHKIVTMGSCFSQHLSRAIGQSGFTYYVAEPAPPGLTAAMADALGYGVFSARYGNVYTVRQAVQLFDRAFGAFRPADDVWTAPAGFVDAFRPRIEPAGFPSADRVRESASAHLACVRQVFLNGDVFVLTLGLTEAWRARCDGAVYPTAPGVSGGSYAPERYEFVNFTVDEVRADLVGLIERLREVNPGARVILTVSPVPLGATFEDRHVLVSNACSKAVLRVAADEAERRFAHVAYFPAYEIVTSPSAEGRYVADDLRQVTRLGVRHVMNVFSRHFFGIPDHGIAAAGAGDAGQPDDPDVMCDDEEITRSLRRAGFN